MNDQMSIFSLMYERKIIKKPIRLIELFAGIGSQLRALQVIFGKDKVESYKICEWAYPSYKAYNYIHIKDFADYSQGKSLEEIIKRVRGTSLNYNEPIADKQLTRKGEKWLRDAYNNIVATHNLVNVMEVHGKDLEIVDTDKYEYVLTYSFPCQDLSLAGKRQGMEISQADGGTRSGLLWEVERILDELNRERDTSTHLPQVLIMENVPEVVGSGNLKHFQKWRAKLESLGYSNYDTIINAKDYGIPQNRRRCFMVSVLGEYHYDFPIEMPLKYRLKDFLEKSVDEKYYLSQKHIDRISNWKAQQKPLEEAIDIEKEQERVSPTLTARGAGEEHSGMILVKESLFKENEIVDFDSSEAFRREHGTNEAPCVVGHPKFAIVEKQPSIGIPIMEATKKGYKIANEGDGIDIGGRMANHRGTVQKGLSQTIKTNCDIGVVVKNEK